MRQTNELRIPNIHEGIFLNTLKVEGVQPQESERACAVCKASKIRQGFSITQWKKGDLTRCKHCITSPKKSPKVSTQTKHSHPQEGKQNMENLKRRACFMCNVVVKERGAFDWSQQLMGTRSKCKLCIRNLNARIMEANEKNALVNVKASRGGASASKAVQPEKCVLMRHVQIHKEKNGQFLSNSMVQGRR